jgi:hypothetical protein
MAAAMVDVAVWVADTVVVPKVLVVVARPL